MKNERNFLWGSNKRWIDSVAIGLEKGVWELPARLIECTAKPFLLVIQGLALLVMGVGLAVMMTPIFVIGGLFGNLRRPVTIKIVLPEQQ